MMYNIDKQKFGAFVSALRKEKGMTQKELAEGLFVSDKAVSKWETAASVPTIDLLIPLAERLGVTVTELLMCERMEKGESLDAAEVEQVVTAAISYSEEKPPRAYQTRSKWGVCYALALAAACLEVLALIKYGHVTPGLITAVVLGGIFGVYFCFFARTSLPAYYDENSISLYTDGAFELHLPGLPLNNGNWSKILKTCRIWAVALMLGYPAVCYLESLIWTGLPFLIADSILSLFLILGGLFLPVYAVGKKAGL